MGQGVLHKNKAVQWNGQSIHVIHYKEICSLSWIKIFSLNNIDSHEVIVQENISEEEIDIAGENGKTLQKTMGVLLSLIIKNFFSEKKVSNTSF